MRSRKRQVTIKRILRSVGCGLLVFLAGCSSLPSFDTSWINQILYTPTPIPVPLQTATSTPVPHQTGQPTTPQPEPAVASPQVLRIWLPPQFNPKANNPAAALLKERLANFEADHPGLEIDVRIKSETGEADLLDSLAVTSMAAPSALPDLIALPRSALETASQKGLIKPLDISKELQDPAWFSYSRELASVNGTPYGIPFAGDALVMVYRPELVWIKSWNDILLSDGQLEFAGADPQAEVALSLYASAGGELTDAQGKPTLDQEVLTGVLELFSKGKGVSLFPDSVKNLSDEDQVLLEYRARKTDMAIYHFSKFRASQDGLYQPLMGINQNQHFTFADSWMWAVTGQTPEQQQLSMDLAEYLTQDEFLSPWLQQTGYLPTRRFGNNEKMDDAIAAVIQASQPLPSADTMQVLGPLLEEAVTRVLNGEEPDAVARSVIEKLK